MTDAGVASRPVRAKLYLQYDCDAEVLNGLVLAQGGEQVRQTRPEEAYLRIDGTGKLVSGNSGNDGTPPDFSWVNGDGKLADGFEASGKLAPGSYTLRAHVLVADDSSGGYTPMDTVGSNIPLEIECGGVAPTQGTPTPTPAATGGQKTPKPTPKETGGVAPTTATNTHGATLPPTDAAGPLGSAPGQDGIRLVAVMLGVAVGTCLLLTPRRRHTTPVERPIEEPTEEDTEQK